MFRRVLTIVLAFGIFDGSGVAVAQERAPRPDRQGDYYDIHTNWRVVDRDRRGLNCRSGAGANYRVVTKYFNGDSIFANTEVEDTIKRDAQGKPWLRVKYDGTGGVACFVRANVRFIRPR